ncbi:MAG: hypothetical protein KDA87_02510 [Planctomycetales bacterium]|nr:hypothetical protein [Planctomycetales bacterium]
MKNLRPEQERGVAFFAFIFLLGLLWLGTSTNIRAQIVYEDGGSHSLTLSSDDDNLELTVLNGSHVALFGYAPNLNVEVDSSTLTDQREKLDGNFTLRAGAKYNASAGDIDESLAFTLDDSVVEFGGGTFGISGVFNVNSSSLSSVNYVGSTIGVSRGSLDYGGQTQLNMSEGVLITDGPFTARDDVVGRVVDSTLPSLILAGQSDFRVTNSTVNEANLDDNWRDGFLVGSGESQVEFDNVMFKNANAESGPHFSNVNASQMQLRNSELTASWGVGGAIAISAVDTSKVLVESTAMSITNVEDSGGRGTTLFSANGAAEIQVRGGSSELSLVSGSGESLAIAKAGGESHIVLDGGSYTLSAYGDDNSTHVARATDDATIELLAGNFNVTNLKFDGSDDVSMHLDADERGTIIVHGSNFNYPIGEVDDLTGAIEGMLVDGNAFHWNFVRTSDARILLVPEPNGLVIGVLLFPYLYRHLRRTKMHSALW